MTASDRKIDGVLDIYVASHAEALKLGTFNAKVTVGK